MIEIDKTVLSIDGKRYEIVPYEKPVNVSEYNETEYPTQITHLIKGFDEDIHLVAEKTGENDIGFSFGQFVGETGLFVSVQDEKVIETANNLVFMAIGEE